jgi:hypothetical protein
MVDYLKYFNLLKRKISLEYWRHLINKLPTEKIITLINKFPSKKIMGILGIIPIFIGGIFVHLSMYKKKIFLFLFITFVSIIFFIYIGTLFNKNIFADKELLPKRGSAEIQLDPIVKSHIKRSTLIFKKSLGNDFGEFSIADKLQVNFELLNVFVGNYSDDVIKISGARYVARGGVDYAVVDFIADVSKEKIKKRINELALIMNDKIKIDYNDQVSRYSPFVASWYRTNNQFYYEMYQNLLDTVNTGNNTPQGISTALPFKKADSIFKELMSMRSSPSGNVFLTERYWSNFNSVFDYMKSIVDKENFERNLITAMEIDEETLSREFKPAVSVSFVPPLTYKKTILAYIFLGLFSGAIISFVILFRGREKDPIQL